MEIAAQTTKKPSQTQPTGYLMGWFGILALSAFLLLAAWNGLSAIAVLLGLALSAAAFSRLWSRLSLAGVTCQRSISEHRLFPGEHVELHLSVANRKLLPLPWVQVDTEVPLGLSEDSSLGAAARQGFGLLSRSTALLWYAKASWRCRLTGRKRGYYPLGDLTVTSGDIFGFYPRSTTLSSAAHIIVYPRLYTITDLGIPSLYPIGETVAERRVFEDPTRTIGVRDYTPRDSLRYIHWKASARHRCLQVKVFEPSTTVKVAIVVGVDTFWIDGALRDGDLELGISAAASVAHYAVEHGSTVGLFVNSRQADSGECARIMPGGDAGHLMSILEALAKTTAFPASATPGFFQRERRELPLGTTLVFVLSRVSPPLADLLNALKHDGYRLLVLQVGGDGDAGVAAEVPWHRVRADSNLMRIAAGGAG